MEHKTLCIPFNKTGFCKFGNTCKYSHIRLNTIKDRNICYICKKEASRPVITNCNHIFCYKCAISSTDNCRRCNEELHGIFYFITTSTK